MNNYKSCFYLYKQNKPEKKIIDIDIDNLDLDDWDYYEQNNNNNNNNNSLDVFYMNYSYELYRKRKIDFFH